MLTTPKYNLDALGDKQFEQLCQSLVQQVVAPGAKIYGMGKDGSREATFHGMAPYPSEKEQWDGNWIFQAKFHDVHQIGPTKARSVLLTELDDELSKITNKYSYKCDNFILMTNVPLTSVFQSGTKDKIDNKIIPKYQTKISNIHVWGADEICRYLDAHPGIRQTYAGLLVSGDIIAHLLGLIERENTDLDELVSLYCQGCFTHEQYADLDDAGDVEDERIALQRVFIDLDVKTSALPQDQRDLNRLPEWLKQAAEDEERISALSYMLDDSIEGLVLIGGPGEGKSTLGRYLAQIYRACLIGQLDELVENVEAFETCIPRIPFRILLREYAQWIHTQEKYDSLFHYLAIQLSRESAIDANLDHIRKIIKTNPLILILDGLDEVPEKTLRSRVMDNINSFVSQVRNVLKGDLRLIATTRPYGYSQEFDPLHYLHISLQKLSSEKALSYANLWTNAREPKPRDITRIRDTFKTCLDDNVVKALTQTTLQVTIILVIIRARGAPPKQREELFDRYMDIIYQREQKKSHELLRTEQDTIYGIHKYLAYILHRRAEKENTAALMDVSEFREKVEVYLGNINPLLEESELKIKTNQIITEASQRLVLIESPQEGKVGFDLPITREFFTAAHLVDTAKNTTERDCRFKAIARSPHWRNVALFFAGRVGRTRPGEAPSMVDMCREIDTEDVDKFLKRGAELVMDMVDDRVLREPHNEIGAIQYGLTLLDSKRLRQSDELINKLNNLQEEYKERVVRPQMEERLTNALPRNLSLYTDIYQELFGVTEPLISAIRRSSESNSEELKLWALSEAIKNKIVDPWVITLFEELVTITPTNKIARDIEFYWANFKYYLNIKLSPKVSETLAISLLNIIFIHRMPNSNLINELSMIKPDGKIKENSLLLWSVSQLLIMYIQSITDIHRMSGQAITFSLPGIVNPKVKEMISKNSHFIRDFCNVFSNEKSSFIRFLTEIFDFLLEPHKYYEGGSINILKYIQEMDRSFSMCFTRILSTLIGPVYINEIKLHDHHQEIYRLFEYYEFEEQFETDVEELNKLVNKNSENVSNHPHKLCFWIDSGFDPITEEFLDLGILNPIKEWFQDRGFSKIALNMYSMEVISDLELFDVSLKITERQLVEGKHKLIIRNMFGWNGWGELGSHQISQLKCVFEQFLTNYPSLINPDQFQFEVLYGGALCAGIIEEKHIINLYDIIKTIPHFFLFIPSRDDTNNAWQTLTNILMIGNHDTFFVSICSLLAMRTFSDERKWIKDGSIGCKLWELSKNKQETWRTTYIKGMSLCQLKWKIIYKNFIDEINGENNEKLQNAWSQVILEAGYLENEDQDAFLKLLLEILRSGDSIAMSIQSAALIRLTEIIPELEAVGFDELSLGLPLAQRAPP